MGQSDSARLVDGFGRFDLILTEIQHCSKTNENNVILEQITLTIIIPI